jgi:5-methylcytosine-specific restriction endonuclease McrA
MNTDKMTRPEMYAALAGRDGPDCFLCKKPFVLNDEGTHITPGQEKTIDHWYPQSFLFAQGKSYEEVWALENLRLAHKSCNAKKGDLVPVDDVTVPTRTAKVPTTRAYKRGVRPVICTNCNSGRDLGPDELCGVCGSGPMPSQFPQFAKAKANECDHEMFWCWLCSIGIVPRKAAIVTVLDGEYLDE